MADLGLPGGNALILLIGAAFVGAILQRLAGQGFGMILSPVMALVAPDFLPGTILIAGLVVGGSSVTADRRDIQRADLPAGFAGRILGAAAAALILRQIAGGNTFGIVISGVVFLGIALSLLGVRVSIRPATLFSAGTLAGVMGTLTGVGAPPMALLYQHVERRRSVATQNLFFLFGMVVSLAMLIVAGLILPRHLALAAILTPSVILALLAARPLAVHLERGQMRPVALSLAGLAATLLLIRSVI